MTLVPLSFSFFEKISLSLLLLFIVDIFFTTLGLIYSCIIVIHGWRLDPILLFSQVLIISISLAAGWENIRLRGLIAKKVKNQLKLFSKNITKDK